MDPDKDTVTTQQLNRKQLLDAEHQLLLQVERLLDKANYFQVSHVTVSFPDSSLHYGIVPFPDSTLHFIENGA